MKSILAITLLIATLSLCNLADKSKPAAESTPANNARPAADSAPATASKAQHGEVDRAALTVELMKIEYDLTTASFNGDVSTLAAGLADDYSGTSVDGSTQNKNQVLSTTKPDKTTKEWKITDGQLVSASEDTAVLNYIQHETLKNGRTYRARVTDTFVKRNGKWLIKSEQQTLLK
ncbi:MAG TPA: nuclear transport factor 2 family protein [Pyrinomonadaceae bacterium]|nr:nuclear transport factor 2 family protein [Pyrinomonadaceae bacterium]